MISNVLWLEVAYVAYLTFGLIYVWTSSNSLFFAVATNEVNRGRKPNRWLFFVCGCCYGLVTLYGWPLMMLYVKCRGVVARHINIHLLKRAMQKDSCRIGV